MSNMLASYGEAIKRWLALILVVSAVASLLVWVVAERWSATSQAHFSYLISLQEREETREFRFDGYYALSATDLFAATLAEWLMTPETVVAAYAEASLSLPSNDPREVGGVVTARKTAPQLVTVTVRHKDGQQAKRLAVALQKVMQRNLERYHEQGVPELAFRAVPTEPWLGQRLIASKVVAGATFVFVFLMAINLIVLRESLRPV